MEVRMFDGGENEEGNHDVRKHSPFLSSHIMAKCLRRQLNQVQADFLCHLHHGHVSDFSNLLGEWKNRKSY